MSECAHTFSTLSATRPSPGISNFGTNTVSWVSQISSHQQSTIINFSHLCSPNPHLHYQHLTPPPEPPVPMISQISHHQQPNPNTLPSISSSSFHQHPALLNSTNPCHHRFYHHDQNPIHHPEISLNTDSESVLSSLTLTANIETEKSKELATCGSIVSTTANGRSQEITVAEEKCLETEPLQDSSSITQSIPQYFLYSCDSNSIASLSTISACESDLGFTGSKPCFDFVFLASNPIHSSCSELETVAWATTVPSPVKAKGNTISATPPEHSILVFDPGGSNVLNAKKKIERAVTIFVFETEKMAVNTISAPPRQSSNFVFDPDGYRHRSRLHFLLTLTYFAQRCLRLFSQLSPVVAVAPPCFASFSVGSLLVITHSIWGLEMRLGLGNVDGISAFQWTSGNGLNDLGLV